MATRLNLVVIFWPETPFFGDETQSRHHFEARTVLFWRRALFSSPICGGKSNFLTTKLVLVVIFVRESPFFGDEIHSRHHFEVKNTRF
ncbi:hypothetical protein NSQ96_16105 [Caldifermentibacillus hisashii]|uniref:hypothetical protein n=1 Tax=Caldifermentibacillus hisashii TaxID=996558 RepID=UPI0031FBC005